MKSGFVVIVGRPNSGKSTLVNSLVNSKISIISDKPQTTRNSIMGIYTDEEDQLVFIDTPGIHKSSNKLGSFMNKQAYSSIEGNDLIYYVVDVTKEFGSGEEFVLNVINNYDIPKFLILNKIDLINKEDLFKIIDIYNEKYKFDEIVPISALEEINLDELIKTSKKYLNEGPRYYDENTKTTNSIEFDISEIIREKAIKFTQQEIPYSIAVVVEKMDEVNNRVHIHSMIVVDRDSQKGILIGKNGSMISKINNYSRRDIEYLLGKKVDLELFVRVEKDWRNKLNKLKDLGYSDLKNE